MMYFQLYMYTSKHAYNYAASCNSKTQALYDNNTNRINLNYVAWKTLGTLNIVNPQCLCSVEVEFNAYFLILKIFLNIRNSFSNIKHLFASIKKSFPYKN